jgi:pilus assembly protein CpaC
MSRVPRWGNQLGRSGLTFAVVLSGIFAIASLATVTSGAVERAERRSAGPDAPATRHIVVILHKSRTISFDKPFRLAVPGSPAIADVKPRTAQTLYIQGNALGTTNVSIYDDNMQLLEIVDLEVAVDTAILQEKIRQSTGGSIRVSSSNGEVVLSGMATNAVAADRAVSIAKGIVQTGQTIVNAMTVAPSQQVMLEVRFLEATRSAERDLGVSWFGTNPGGTQGFSTGRGTPNIGPTVSTSTSSSGTTTSTATNTGGISVIQSAGALLSASGTAPFGVVLANLVNNGTGNLNVMISALEAQGLVRRLAEPNLVALSGETAKFLAGGSFPVPTISSTTNGAITPTFQFVDFGVSLTFVPTVLKDGLINVHIAPEVSELDFANAVTISGTTIPSLIKRNAATTIELRDGQSFAIAGLLQTRSVRNLDQLPWIGSVPVLGALFRSSAYQNSESDLVIIVTPHLVRPGTPADRLASPLDQRLPSNDVDFFVNGQLEVPKKYSDYVTSGGDVQGPYGAIIPVEQGSNQPVYKGGMAK